MALKIIVFTTCGSRKEAGRIARVLVDRRLAACVNILESLVESVYRWKGRVDTAKEFLLIIKSTRARFAALRDKILELHSYDVPEIIATSITAASDEYLAWLTESVRSEKKHPRRRQTFRLRRGPDRDRQSGLRYLQFPPINGSSRP